MNKDLINSILTNENNKSPQDIIKENKDSFVSAYEEIKDEDKRLEYIKKLEQKIKDQEKIIDNFKDDEETSGKPKKDRKAKTIDVFNLLNLYKFFKTEDGKLFKDDNENSLYKYDPFESAFDKNINKYRDYQKNFIKDWSLSEQELAILYYGVGTGKTLIAITCAEEYTRVEKDAYVYFLTPSSLVLGTILEMFSKGIDPTIKDKDGNNIYNFISYQQIIRTIDKKEPKEIFKENSLLIIDEVHNLRSLRMKEETKGRMKGVKKTGRISLVGSAVGKLLLEYGEPLKRKLFMSGTLMVNEPYDIEAPISIGYRKIPNHEGQFSEIINNDENFKNYFQGLISFYRIGGDNLKSMPSVKYNFIPVEYEHPKGGFQKSSKEELKAFMVYSRTNGIEEKNKWILNLIKKKPNEKTIIYTQFYGKTLLQLYNLLKENNIKVEIITGKLNPIQKLNVVSRYNNNEINVLLFTLAIKEGISFKETNNMIVYEPYWNYAILEQVIARAIRLTSHKLGSKSLVNVYLPFLFEELYFENAKKFKKIADDIMNNGIKNYIIKDKPSDFKGSLTEYSNFKGLDDISRDTEMYIRMFNKQANINEFEKRLLALPRFEEINNIENNEFIAKYNQVLLDYQSKNGRLPTNKAIVEMKRSLYDKLYGKRIDNITTIYERFSTSLGGYFDEKNDIEPDNDINMTDEELEQTIRTLINQNSSLDLIFEKVGITRETIVNFQANFTPPDVCDRLIKFSRIEDDTNENITILEGSAGVGNMITALLKLNNRTEFRIDANEYNKVFYNIGKINFEGMDNINWYNQDFFNFNSRYNYDYIIGNPPFNLSYKVNNKKVRKYDIDFVEKSFNSLNPNGVLCMLIGSKYTFDTSKRFERFREYLKVLDTEQMDFKEGFELKTEDKKKFSKLQKTKTSMRMIRIVRPNNFIMDLNSTGKIIINNDEPLKQKEELTTAEKREQLKELITDKKEVILPVDSNDNKDIIIRYGNKYEKQPNGYYLGGDGKEYRKKYADGGRYYMVPI